MLTGRAAADRPWVNYLAPRRVFEPIETTPPSMLRGECEGMLRQSARLTRQRQRNTREQHDRASNPKRYDDAGRRTIPTGGPGRRRTKARRNARAVAETAAFLDA